MGRIEGPKLIQRAVLAAQYITQGRTGEAEADARMCLLPANSHTPFPSPNGGGAARRRDRLSRSPGWPRGVHRAARHLRAQ
uniref:Uncharacterized protein n=1 Tax=Oryza glumipatula TaxID=40148 RepID=A0A0D9YBJ0_9ORYZ